MLYFWKALGTRTTVALLPDVTHTNTGRQRQIQERKQRNFEIGQVCPYTLDGASWISSGPSIGPYCPYILKMIRFWWPTTRAWIQLQIQVRYMFCNFTSVLTQIRLAHGQPSCGCGMNMLQNLCYLDPHWLTS